MKTLAIATGDVGAVAVITASLLGWIPAAAGFIAIIWYAIQIWESDTMQRVLKSYRLRKLVQLRAKATALELLIREKKTGVEELNAANRVHAAAIIARQHVYEPKTEPEIVGAILPPKGVTGAYEV